MLLTSKCPECGSYDTEKVHVEWHEDYVEIIRICNKCPTEYVISMADPRIEIVNSFEE